MVGLSWRQRRIGLQLLKEFWLPLLVAGAWTVFAPKPNGPLTVSVLLTSFAPAFFFVSWMLAQLFRIAKQVKTESSLKQISTRLEDVVTGVQQSTKETAAWATGGNSYAYALPIRSSGVNSPPSNLTILTVGAYPLFGVKARIVDVDALESQATSVDSAIAAQHWTVELGDLERSTTYNNRIQLAVEPLIGGVDRRFNVFFSARNGQWVQLLRYRYDGATWHVAYRVSRIIEEGQYEILEEQLPDNFPDPDTVSWG
ncbi:hypothetical protein D3C87_503080 [compost metagenome]